MNQYSQMEKNTVASKGQLEDSKIIRFENLQGKGVRVMFVGNSITLHGIRPEIGWHHCWGMAASAKEKDYVHRLMRTIKEKDEGAAFCICHVSEWERCYLTGNEVLNEFAQARRFEADIIIMRFVENCPKTEFKQDIFKTELERLLQYLDGSGKAKFILTTGFWKHPGDDSIRQLASEKDWPLVELGDLGEDDRMKAIGLFEHKGVANHPGDLGMENIAKRIFEVLPLKRAKKKVIAAGHICLDVTPIFPQEKIERVEDILKPGRLIEMQNVSVSTGGSVANTGLALKILGADVSLMGKIGNDNFGKLVLNVLEKYDAAEGMIVSDDANTSYSVVLSIPGIDRIFLHDPGANANFCADDIPYEKLEEAALFHFGYPPLMKQIYRDNGSELVKMMKRAKAMGVATSLDFTSIDETSEAGKVDWFRLLQNVMPYIDFFVPSVEELCYMLDKERFVKWQEQAAGKDVTEILDIEADVKPLADICMELGAKVLLIKCGAKGMYYCTADWERLKQVGERVELDIDKWVKKEGFEKSFIPERIASGTGAGDTSIAAFLTAMLEGASPEESVQLAAATGASCVAAYDALGGLKSLPELRRKIASGWAKNA